MYNFILMLSFKQRAITYGLKSIETALTGVLDMHVLFKAVG